MDDEAALREALALLEAGDVAGACEAFALVTEREPELADAWHLRGVAEFHADRLDAAEASIRRALALAPNTAAYWVNAANIQRRRGALGQARDALLRAVKIDPEDAAAHCNLGTVLAENGQLDAGEASYRRAADLQPTMAAAYQGLAWTLAIAGRGAALPEVYQRWSAAAPDDPTAQWLAGGEPTAPAVRAYFDRFAATYDRTLDELRYGVPERIAALLPTPSAAWTVLDAGCGTGRAASWLRPFAATLVGVDLSPAMLAAAERTQAYDELLIDDACAVLTRRRFDLVVAADVMPYMPDPRLLLRGGDILAFSFELADGRTTVRRPSGRIAHAAEPVRAALREAGYHVLQESSETLRSEGGAPVEGLIVIAGKERGRQSIRPPA